MESRKWYRWTYLQGRSLRCRHREQICGHSGGRGMRWTGTWVDIYIYILVVYIYILVVYIYTCWHIYIYIYIYIYLLFSHSVKSNWSPPDSSVHGISQEIILQWVAIYFSRESSQPRDWPSISYISCISGQVRYRWATREAPIYTLRAC